MKLRHIVLALFTVCTLLAVAAPAGAQDVDLGNDGIGMNCEDFPERNAVEGYFAQDGGSAERNVDGLDPDGDGIPCNEVAYDGGDGSDDGGADPVDAGDEPVTVVETPAPVTRLPQTGSGSTAEESRADVLALVATLAALAAAVIANVRRRDLI